MTRKQMGDVQAELTAVWAAVVALRDLDSPKAKAIFLRDTLKKRPELVRYWRAAYEYRPGALFRWLPKELREVAELVIAGDLGHTTSGVVAKVFDKLGLPPLAAPPTVKTNINLEITSVGKECLTAVLMFNEDRIANLSILMKQDTRTFFAKLEGLGIKVSSRFSY